MPTFETPEPILLTLHVDAGAARITAGKRTDTEVSVQPGSAGSQADLRAVEQTRVEYADGKLLVRTQKQGVFGRPGSVLVEIALPEGSRVNSTGAMGDFTLQGALGECRLKTAVGGIRLDEAGPLQLATQHGDISVDRVAGDLEATTGAGEVRIGAVEGAAQIKNSHGGTRIEEVTGALRLKAADGDIRIGRAHASVAASSAHGAIRIGEVARGSVQLETRMGDLEIGVRQGTAAWLDIDSGAGTVRSELDAAEGPAQGEETVELRARTRYGHITVRRA